MARSLLVGLAVVALVAATGRLADAFGGTILRAYLAGRPAATSGGGGGGVAAGPAAPTPAPTGTGGQAVVPPGPSPGLPVSTLPEGLNATAPATSRWHPVTRANGVGAIDFRVLTKQLQ